jgi:hypothetical protein
MTDQTTSNGIRRSVLFRTLQQPITLYPTAVGILGGIALGLFGANPLVLAAAIGGLGAGAGSFLLNYFVRQDQFTAVELDALRTRLAERERQLVASLRTDLKRLIGNRATDAYTHQAIKQLEMAQDRFDTFRSLLSRKLKVSELTFGRYLVAAEQVRLAVLDNLGTIASQIESVSAIEDDYIDERLRELTKLKKPSTADIEERQTLEERSKLRESQLERINVLLTRNEEAITKFDASNSAIAEMKGASRRSDTGIETATAELEAIAKRARGM